MWIAVHPAMHTPQQHNAYVGWLSLGILWIHVLFFVRLRVFSHIFLLELFAKALSPFVCYTVRQLLLTCDACLITLFVTEWELDQIL